MVSLQRYIVCLDKTTTGDGIIAALQVLVCMVKQEKNLNQLLDGIQLLPQTLINIKTVNAGLFCGKYQVSKNYRVERKLRESDVVFLQPFSGRATTRDGEGNEMRKEM